MQKRIEDRKRMARLAAGLALVVGIMACDAPGMDIYVSTNATPTAPYNTWATAFTKLQDALDYAGAKSNATIYLAGGQELTGPVLGPAFPDNTVFRWQNVANMALRGGYNADPRLAAEAHPGPRTAGPTVLKRTTGEARVLTLSAIFGAVIEQVTLRDGAVVGRGPDGYTPSAGYAGGGVFLTGCRDVTIKDCLIINNTGNRGGYGYTQFASGGGIAMDHSTAKVTDTIIAENELTPAGDMQAHRGAGVFVGENSHLTLTRSKVRDNRIRSDGNNQNQREGSGFHVIPTGILEIFETVIEGNTFTDPKNAGYGAAGCNEGTLTMRSSLVLGNSGAAGSSDGIHLAGGVATLANCTIVNNGAIGLRYGGGAVSVTNCILRGHSVADLANFPVNAAGHLLNVGHSAFTLPATMAGIHGCMTHDPLFVNAAANDYRLQETPFSPCIDKGANASWMMTATDLDGEPRMQREAVDMGAYEYRPAPPRVQNGGASNVTAKTATVYGQIVSVGGEAEAAVLLYYGLSDGGTNRAGWDNVYRLPGPRKVGGCYTMISPSRMISTNRSDALWHYRFCATNIYGAGWSQEEKCFLAGAVGVKVTKRESTEEKPAAFVISRPATATNGPLDVYFTLGGTGVNGVDYDRIAIPATIPAGATEAHLPVAPNFNMGENRSKGVELTLAPGGYLIGPNSKASVVTRAVREVLER